MPRSSATIRKATTSSCMPPAISAVKTYARKNEAARPTRVCESPCMGFFPARSAVNAEGAADFSGGFFDLLRLPRYGEVLAHSAEFASGDQPEPRGAADVRHVFGHAHRAFLLNQPDFRCRLRVRRGVQPQGRARHDSAPRHAAVHSR